MKKKMLSVVLILALMVSLQSSSIATNSLENLSENEPEEIQVEDEAIFVGYFESDRKDIFGDLSDEEISEIMVEISETLGNTDSSIERHNFVQSLDSRISVSY